MVLLLWESLLVSLIAKRFVPSDVCCHGHDPTRFFMTRQRDFLFRYHIFRKLRCPCRSRPVRAVVSLENKALSRYHRSTFLVCAREVPPARQVLPRKSSTSTTRFAWPGLAPTSGISLNLTVTTTRTPSTAQAPLFVTLSSTN